MRTENSFLNFNIINHPTFSISELRNLHVYNGGFENKDTNANVAQTGSIFRIFRDRQTKHQCSTDSDFSGLFTAPSARDFEKTKHNLRIEKEGSCKQVVRAPWFPEQTVAD